MKRDRLGLWFLGVCAALLLSSLTSGNIAATSDLKQGKEQPPATLRVRPNDVATRDGFEHFYNMDYDAAILDFELALRGHPEDPSAVNHFLQGVLIRELNREGALNAGLYLGDEFLGVQKVRVDPKAEAQIKELTERALRLCAQRLKANPNDVDTLYARGVTRGLRSVYIALVEKAWFAALRSGLGSYDDHQQVLRISPCYSDAKLVVGAYADCGRHFESAATATTGQDWKLVG